MNEMLRRARDAKWVQVITQCNRETAEKQITKMEWLNSHGVNAKTFYKKQKELRDCLLETMVSNDGEAAAASVQRNSSFVEVPAFCSNNPYENVGVDHSVNASVSSGWSSDLTIKTGGISIEISNSISPVLLSFVREVLAHA